MSRYAHGKDKNHKTPKADSKPRKEQAAFATRWKGRWGEVVRNAEDAARVANGLGVR